MVKIARVYLGLQVLLFSAVGIFALTAPQSLLAQFDLVPQSAQGTAEARSLYGGAFLAWALIIVGAWRYKSLRRGLLASLALSIGLIATARILSLAIDHVPDFNVPAMIFEWLIVVACWIVYRDEKAREPAS